MNHKLYKITMGLLITVSTSLAQIATDGLVAYYPFNGNANDLSGNENHGTVNGAVLATDRFGATNSAYSFDGVSSSISISASPSLNTLETNNKISISAWININHWYQNWNVFPIFQRYNPNTDAGWTFEANWSSGGLLWSADETSTTNYIGAPVSWTFNKWYHVCLVYDSSSSNVKFYVDNVLVANSVYNQPIKITDNTSPFDIGKSLAGPDEYTDGLIDDIRIYNRAITANEVSALFNEDNTVTAINDDDTKLDAPMKVYPNPASDHLIIENSPINLTNRHHIEVTNVWGQNVYSSDFNQTYLSINLDNWQKKGLYIVKLLDAQNAVVAMKKVIVQ